MRWIAALLVVFFPSLAGAQSRAPRKTPDTHAQVRGVTVSCQTWGWEWGSDAMLPALDRIVARGGNWVAIHPYARIRRDGTVAAFRLGDTPPRWLSRPLAEARQRKLKVLIKPHLAYWGSGFSWRGAITFDDAASWSRFFTSYRAWIVKVAQLTQGGDAFAVGTELGGTTQHVGEWRKVIQAVRKVTRAPLTYAANWDRYQRVAFWDALDVIGIQAYLPLVQHDRPPTAAELKAGWKRVMARVSAYGKKHGRRVVFTELGYDRTSLAARKPWESGRRHPPSNQGGPVQARCMEAALRAIAGEPRVVGAFLWKAFAGRSPREDFRLDAPAVRAAIEKAWKKQAAKPKPTPRPAAPSGSRGARTPGE